MFRLNMFNCLHLACFVVYTLHVALFRLNMFLCSVLACFFVKMQHDSSLEAGMFLCLQLTYCNSLLRGGMFLWINMTCYSSCTVKEAVFKDSPLDSSPCGPPLHSPSLLHPIIHTDHFTRKIAKQFQRVHHQRDHVLTLQQCCVDAMLKKSAHWPSSAFTNKNRILIVCYNYFTIIKNICYQLCLYIF